MKLSTQNIVVGIGALFAAYFAYGQYQVYLRKKQIEAAIAGRPGAVTTVLESLSTHNPTTGAGVRKVVVPVGPSGPGAEGHDWVTGNPCEPDDITCW